MHSMDFKKYSEVRHFLHKEQEKSFRASSTDSASHSPASVYGFAAYFLSFFALAGFVAWAFHLVSLPVDSTPSRYWAIAIPTWICEKEKGS